MALKIDIRPGQSIQIGDVTVKLVKKSGQVACLIIDADKSVKIQRTEVSERGEMAEPCALQA